MVAYWTDPTSISINDRWRRFAVGKRQIDQENPKVAKCVVTLDIRLVESAIFLMCDRQRLTARKGEKK